MAVGNIIPQHETWTPRNLKVMLSSARKMLRRCLVHFWFTLGTPNEIVTGLACPFSSPARLAAFDRQVVMMDVETFVLPLIERPTPRQQKHIKAPQNDITRRPKGNSKETQGSYAMDPPWNDSEHAMQHRSSYKVDESCMCFAHALRMFAVCPKFAALESSSWGTGSPLAMLSTLRLLRLFGS